jgi:hypothetical protein
MWTGCGAEQDEDGAMIWWGKIADATHPEGPSHVSRHIQTRALSCLASAFRERSNMDHNALQIDHLYRAGKLADMAAALGFVSPNILGIAGRIEEVGLRRQADCRFNVDTTRYGELEFLWSAFEAHRARMNSKDQQRDSKASKAPNLYRCAAEGCGIEATSKSGLSKCSGPCPTDVKPSYCSKECQITVGIFCHLSSTFKASHPMQDWKRHKNLCKASAKARQMQPGLPSNDGARGIVAENSRDDGRGPIEKDDGELAIEAQETQLMPSSDDSTYGENFRDGEREPMTEKVDGKELMIEVPAPGRPGGKMKIASTTWSPAHLRELRTYLEKDAGTSEPST